MRYRGKQGVADALGLGRSAGGHDLAGERSAVERHGRLLGKRIEQGAGFRIKALAFLIAAEPDDAERVARGPEGKEEPWHRG